MFVPFLLPLHSTSCSPSFCLQMYRGSANAALFFLAAAKAKKERHEERGARKEHEESSTTSAVNPHAQVAPELHDADHAAANEVEHDVDELDSGSESDGYANSESSASDESSDEELPTSKDSNFENAPPERISATGHLPPFAAPGVATPPSTLSSAPSSSASSSSSRHHHKTMIRQRVSLYGVLRPLEPPSELPGCTMNPEHIGLVHSIPVRKWLKQRAEWDSKYSSDLVKYQELKTRDRVLAEENGFLLGQFKGERPPLTSVAAWHDQKLAKEAAASVDEIGHKTNASMALAAWSRISGKPDEEQAGDEKVEETKEKVGEEQVAEAEATKET
jgi:hypothetical protein